jgi:alpha-2-macroglobulin
MVPAERPMGIRADQAYGARRQRHDGRCLRQAGAFIAARQVGRYRLEVSTGEVNGPVTSLSFDAGFYAEASADTPDLLEVALDKPDYKSGDTMNVAVTARTAGRLTINVFTDRLVATQSQDVKVGTVRASLAVGREWGTGAYMVATLRRPLDAPAQRMPGLAIGVQWFSIDKAARTVALDMELPATMRPNAPLTVPIKIAGLSAGEEARVVVAAVDVGILNLTNYKPPAPDDYYLGSAGSRPKFATSMAS